MYALKKQIVKTYMYSQCVEQKYPNVSKEELLTIKKQVLEIKSCVDLVEKLFKCEEDKEDLDLESVMETGSLPENFKSDT